MIKPPEFNMDALQNGIYSAPEALDELRRVAASRGIAWCDLDLANIFAKKTFLERCESALNFPAGFGRNWDALADCLEDLSWQPQRGIVVYWHGGGDFAQRAHDDMFTALEIFGAAATYWQERSRVMLVILDQGSAGNRVLPAFHGK
jgi:hypothetical protein